MVKDRADTCAGLFHEQGLLFSHDTDEPAAGSDGSSEADSEEPDS